jgi:hypothetical protein
MVVVLGDRKVVGSCYMLVFEERLLVWARSRRRHRRKRRVCHVLHCRLA